MFNDEVLIPYCWIGPELHSSSRAQVISHTFSCFVLIHLRLFISVLLSVSSETLRLLLKTSPCDTLQLNPLTCYSKYMD